MILFMVKFMRIFICSSMKVSLIILHLFEGSISLSMASSKSPGLGMPRWTTFFSHKDLKDANMILMCNFQHLDDSIQKIVLYVYDHLIIVSCISDIGSIECSLHNAFSMTDLGLLKRFLGLEIEKCDVGTKVKQ